MADAIADDPFAETVELAIGGLLYSGWTVVSVTKALEAMSGHFELTLAHKASTADAEPFPIKPGDRCELKIGGETVINGWIDIVAPSIGKDAHSISVTGRDRTGDLADCSAIHKPGSWKNVKIEAIAAELVKPFGLKVTARADTGRAIARFALQQGETVQAALERLLRFRGLLLAPTATGDLEIITPAEGAPVAVLELGVNILSAEARHDHSDRFSEYRVKGQASGDDHHHGKAVAQIQASAIDPGVERYRPLLIVAEDQGDGASLGTRAKWEAGVRAGKSISSDVTVKGWRVAVGGKLWSVNVRVRLKCAAVQIADAEMLVTAVELSKGDAGTTAKVTLMPPGAWKQLAAPEKVAKAKKRAKR